MSDHFIGGSVFAKGGRPGGGRGPRHRRLEDSAEDKRKQNPSSRSASAWSALGAAASGCSNASSRITRASPSRPCATWIPSRLQAGIALVKKINGAAPAGYCKGEYEYRNMFQRDDLDGIVVATGVQVLGRIAVDAMKAGKNVATEVTGPYTLDDCWGIVEEKERSGKHYMLLEECCYDDVNLMILGMVKRGLFGEPYYAECSYVHDIKVDAGMPASPADSSTPTRRSVGAAA